MAIKNKNVHYMALRERNKIATFAATNSNLKNKLMTIQKKLGMAIVTLRRVRGISQEDFARIACIDRGYMSAIENGKRQVSIGMVERIAEAFDISLSMLFMEVEKIEI